MVSEAKLLGESPSPTAYQPRHLETPVSHLQTKCLSLRGRLDQGLEQLSTITVVKYINRMTIKERGSTLERRAKREG